MPALLRAYVGLDEAAARLVLDFSPLPSPALKGYTHPLIRLGGCLSRPKLCLCAQRKSKATSRVAAESASPTHICSQSARAYMGHAEIASPAAERQNYMWATRPIVGREEAACSVL